MRPGSQSRVARSRVLASKKFFIINREKPIGWRMDCPRSERIESRKLSGSWTICSANCRHADSTNLLGTAGARAEQRGYSVCPVVNENGIVLGVIGKRDWDTDPTASVQQLMDSAPTTLRPSDPLEKAQQLLQKIDHGAVLITDSDGKLLGAFLGAANNEEAGRKQQGPQSEVRSR